MLVCILIGAIAVGFFVLRNNIQILPVSSRSSVQIFPSAAVLPTPTLTPLPLPNQKSIPLRTHVFQTFNNCGPASLSMLLSYQNFTISQQELGQELRPYQHPQGDNDDKSVTVAELAKKAERLGFTVFYRPNGTMEQLQQFIAAGFPVLVRTWLNETDDIGHYRIVRGYDTVTQQILQDDSYQGKDLQIPYAVFERMWRPFHYEYMVIGTTADAVRLAAIVGESTSTAYAWESMRERAQREYSRDQSSYSLFTQSVAEYYLGRYGESVRLYELVKAGLPRRMLWYQIEPIEAYLALGNSAEVFRLTDEILNDENRAFSELYILRAKAYRQMGDEQAATREDDLAQLYRRPR